MPAYEKSSSISFVHITIVRVAIAVTIIIITITHPSPHALPIIVSTRRDRRITVYFLSRSSENMPRFE